METDKWTLDRGAGYYATERVKRKLACLVQTGKHAGRSRVRYVGVTSQKFWIHILRRDFYTTAVNAKLIQLVAVLVVWYFLMLLGWSTVYYAVWRWNDMCFIGFHGFRSAFMYATETQQTIGYGERATGECWLPAVLVSIHSLQAVLLDSVILGIVFSRISHPKQRSRTVLISDCACIARRDGQLKFMFRVADIQKRSVIDPRVRVVMYSWGGRRTAEGETMPVLAQELSVSLECTLLLPVTVEHAIDETSPLFGLSALDLEVMRAEIVVTLEAASELGDTFMARQSYLPSEIHWGHTFVNIVHLPKEQSTEYEVDLSRFHDVEPQPGLSDEMTQPNRLSRKVVAGVGAGNLVPARLLNENTLVLSSDAVVAYRNGRPYLMFRLGDTFPGHVVDVQVTAHLYRWHVTTTEEGETIPYEEHPLELEPVDLLLRYPVTLVHDLDPARSPVAHWASQRGLQRDADAELVVVARGTLYSRQEVITRTRVYRVLGDVKWGHVFLPVVLTGSGTSSKLGAAVDWSQFHATAPLKTMEQLGTPGSPSPRPSALGYGPMPGTGAADQGGPSGSQPMTLLPPLAPGGPRPAPRLAAVSAQGGTERSGSSGSLTALFLQHQQPSQLAPPAAAVRALEPPGLVFPVAQAAHLSRTPSFPQLLRPAAIQRSPSTIGLQSVGADGQARPVVGFAAPGVVPSGPGRRAEDDATGNSDEPSSGGNTTTYWSGGQWMTGASGQRQTTGTGMNPETQGGKQHSERTWHNTRSLFAALENIQAYNMQQQQQSDEGEVAEADPQPGSEAT
ncbi:hypothetical protein PLESTM_000067800 [Pleodorina starrii]|nr:hypothetical protein PLESTM_000067800 [Pleodorina starrii]